jgi:anaerobic selenocysteine-containing dehydrogenase
MGLCGIKREKAKFKAKVTPISHPGVVTTPHGWFLPETDGKEPCLFSTGEHNVNQITGMGNQSKSGFGGTNYRTSLVRIRKVD